MKFIRRQFLKFVAAAITAPCCWRLAVASGLSDAADASAADPMPGPAADFGRLIADETEKWGKVVRAGGLKPE